MRSSIAPFLLSVLVVSGCELVNNESEFFDPNIPVLIRYDDDIQPILTANCTSCHGAPIAEAGLRLDSWANAIAGSNFGEALIPFSPDRSRMIRMIADSAVPHPVNAGGDSLSADDLSVLRQWIAGGARSAAGAVPYANATDVLYVSNRTDATVSVIDRATNLVIRVVDLVAAGFSPDAQPVSVAVEPDGSHWYVALTGQNAIARFDRQNRLAGSVNFVAPGPMVIHPTEDLMYVSRETTVPNPPLSIGRIFRSTMSLTEIPVVFPRPHALAFDPDAASVVVGSYGQNGLARVGVADDAVELIPLDGPAHAMQHGLLHSALSSAGGMLVTTAALSSQLLIFDASDPDSLVFVDAIPLNGGPTQPAFLPNAQVVYVPSGATNTVARVSLDPPSVDRVIFGDGIASPNGVSVSADGRYVYVANSNPPGPGAWPPRHTFESDQQTGTVVVIDTTTDTVVRVIEVGRTADGMAAAG